MTSNCPSDLHNGRSVSVLFSSACEIEPGIRVRIFHPPAVPACLALIDLDELEAVFRTDQAFRAGTVMLSPAEQKRFAAYTYPKRRKEWLGGRLACKSCVLELLGLTPSADLFAAVSIVPAASGAPLVSASPALGRPLPSVSISHSGRYAAAMAAAGGACGVDIQRVTARTLTVADRFAEAGERLLLRSAAPGWDEARRLTLLWTAKEALKKSLPPGRPGFFRDLILRAVRCGPGISLNFSGPRGAGNQLEVTAACLDDYLLAYTIRQSGHA
ncbi:MAG TPA: 4'-phosphopantetheinyl transferase superfamily protein [Desulfobacteraceae bacterium]|nr:4'-phosphopantetheinyl transferase superfamily protein [Desulfobacteraceae bacterium]